MRSQSQQRLPVIRYIGVPITQDRSVCCLRKVQLHVSATVRFRCPVPLRELICATFAIIR